MEDYRGNQLAVFVLPYEDEIRSVEGRGCERGRPRRNRPTLLHGPSLRFLGPIRVLSSVSGVMALW